MVEPERSRTAHLPFQGAFLKLSPSLRGCDTRISTRLRRVGQPEMLPATAESTDVFALASRRERKLGRALFLP
jgi:hypothetical protein